MENRESSPHGGLQRDRRSSLPTDNSTISDEEKARPPAEPQTGTQPSDGGIVPRENDGGEKAEQSPAPDGGLAAWLVAVGASCSFFCCLGFANSFGTFAEYYLTHQLRGRSPDDVSWIGSLSSFLQFFSGAVGGPLFDRFGAKVRARVRLPGHPDGTTG
ncbi:hypothetical protein VTK73DRAFT_2520 [Phialemonium thermophilum]|uniref:Major facilitator superfamily (MFS) profile domain-containing protein n=1 Tax=Phialemonium thermophilum TaxID=223376 RepID=A0ABR3VS19_9PEZI